MIEREIAYVQSLTMTVEFCTRKSADFAELPTFAEEVTNLGKLVSQIREQNQILEISTQGYTAAKNTSKELLYQTLLPVLKRIQAYARISHDQVLQNAVKLTNTGLLRIHDSMLSDTCRAILALCEQRMAELLPYGLTPEMLEATGSAIADFNEKMIGTPQYRGEQKAAKQNIDDSLAEATDIVKNKLDVLAEIIKDTNQQTYIEYKNSRKAEHTGSRTLALKGKVIDADTALPIAGVTISIVIHANGDAKTGSELAKVVKITAAKGGFQLKTLATGTYSITAAKEGYAEQTTSVYINEGELSEVKIALKRL